MSLLRMIYHLLYHQFAWTYDLVASAVSLGHWKDWGLSTLPYLEGRVLEIGFGPGHLQLAMQMRGLEVFGLDESRQMSWQARRRLHNRGFQVNLALGYAQNLPFPTEAFEKVVTTFPSEFIFETQTLLEIRRVLTPAGSLVIVPMAWITGKSLLERMAVGLFKVTNQAGENKAIIPSIKMRLDAGGFTMHHELVKYPGSQVLLIIASKSLAG